LIPTTYIGVKKKKNTKQLFSVTEKSFIIII